MFTKIYLKKGNWKKKRKKNSHIDQFEQNFHQKKDKDLYYNTLQKILRLVTIYYILASAILV